MLDREEKKKETKNHINLYLSNKWKNITTKNVITVVQFNLPI
jgi:hypothetical protein